MRRLLGLSFLAFMSLCFTNQVFGQSLGNAGTIEGTVVDPSGAVVAKAEVTLTNPVSGYRQMATTGGDGAFRLVNIPPNSYHLEVTAPGFSSFTQDVSVRNSVPIQIKSALSVTGGRTSVTVEAAGADILENDPSAHVDIDRNLIMKLPSFDPAGSLSQVIMQSTGGVAAED